MRKIIANVSTRQTISRDDVKLTKENVVKLNTTSSGDSGNNIDESTTYSGSYNGKRVNISRENLMNSFENMKKVDSSTTTYSVHTGVHDTTYREACDVFMKNTGINPEDLINNFIK